MPRLVLTTDHPVLPIVINGIKVCMINKGRYIDATTNCEYSGDYVVIVPHKSTEIRTDPLEPILWLGRAHISLYALLRNGLFLYEASFSDGKVSYVRHPANEEILRGVTLIGDASNIIGRITEILLRSYVRASFFTYSMYIKRTPEAELRFGLKKITRGRKRIYVGNGIVIIRESWGEVEDTSIVATVDSLSLFEEISLELVKTSRVIHDVNLGRATHSMKTVLDIFLPKATYYLESQCAHGVGSHWSCISGYNT